MAFCLGFFLFAGDSVFWVAFVLVVVAAVVFVCGGFGVLCVRLSFGFGGLCVLGGFIAFWLLRMVVV